MKNVQEIVLDKWRLNIRYFIFLFKLKQKNMYIIILLTAISSLVPLVELYLTRDILNLITENNSIIQILEKLSWLILVVLIQYGSNYYKKILSFDFSKNLEMHIERIIINRIRNLPIEKFEGSELYDVLKKISDQGEGVFVRYFYNSLSFIESVIILSVSSTVIFSWSIVLFIMTIMVSMIVSYLQNLIGHKNFEVFNKIKSEERKIWYYKYVLKNIMFFKDVKIFGLYNYFFNKYQENFTNITREQRTVLKETNKIELFCSILDTVLTISLFIEIFLKNKINSLPVGNVVAYVQLFNNIRSSIQALFLNIVDANIDLMYLNLFFEFVEINETKFTDGSIIKQINTIELVNVNLFKNEKIILENINIKLEKGNKYLVVGKNGSGKSSLVNLILGLYESYDGEILINNINISEINKESYWRRTGVLFQYFSQFELTMRENIELDSHEKIEEQSNILGKELISEANIDKQLGAWFNDGRQLSGGEWQKIGIMRAMIHSKDLLILDEPKSHLDILSQERLVKILRAQSDQIMVEISHDIEELYEHVGKIIIVKDCTAQMLASNSELEKYEDIFE